MGNQGKNYNFKHKIAITGQMGSGKSTLANLIRNTIDCYITSFSSPIREILKGLNLPITRNILQETGDFFRKFNETVWAEFLLKEIESISKNIVIDGIRYKFEMDLLAKNGFTIIKIMSKEDLRRDRIIKRDKISVNDELWNSWTSHPTETFTKQIDSKYIIENNLTIDDLSAEIQKILNQLTLN